MPQKYDTMQLLDLGPFLEKNSSLENYPSMKDFVC